MEYKVLYAETLKGLEQEIEYYRILGWKVYGGMTICSREQYYQTMTS